VTDTNLVVGDDKPYKLLMHSSDGKFGNIIGHLLWPLARHKETRWNCIAWAGGRRKWGLLDVEPVLTKGCLKCLKGIANIESLSDCINLDRPSVLLGKLEVFL
jgi:hypothetical protein